MAVGFGIADVKGFPFDKWHTTQQTKVDFDDDVVTSVEPVSDWSHPDFRKFQVMHESRLFFEGRFRNEPIDTVVRRYRFDVYLDAPGGRAFFCGPKKLWQEAMQRIQRDQHSTLEYAPRELDLIALRSALEGRVSGGWFGDMQIARIESAGLFGPDVAKSDEWEHYEQMGHLSAIILELTYRDRAYNVMLVQDSTVVLYRSLGEIENLAFVKQLMARIEATMG
jgi:hypothetical protein